MSSVGIISTVDTYFSNKRPISPIQMIQGPLNLQNGPKMHINQPTERTNMDIFWLKTSIFDPENVRNWLSILNHPPNHSKIVQISRAIF